MRTVRVGGIRNLKYAVITKHGSEAVSVHQYSDAAEKFRLTCAHPDEFEVVEMLDPISYVQR